MAGVVAQQGFDQGGSADKMAFRLQVLAVAAQDTTGFDGFRQVLGTEGQSIGAQEIVAAFVQGGSGGQDAADGGLGLDPGGQAHGMAGHHLKFTAPAGSDQAGVDTDPEAERWIALPGQSGGKGFNCVLKIQRGIDRSDGIIFVDQGIAKNCHHGIANVFLHAAFMQTHDRLKAGEETVHQLVDFLRVKAFRQSRKTGQIGKYDGYRATVAIFQIGWLGRVLHS